MANRHNTAQDGIDYPLVSCICPTRNRPEFLPFAVSYFQRQDYPNLELIIIDDSDYKIRFTCEDSRVMSVKINPPNSIGAKRNMACEFAKGDLICHWDDDDWYDTDRVSSQVAVMQDHPEMEATGYRSMIFARNADQKAWRFSGDSCNLVGVSLMYRRSWWKDHRFDESLPFGEDNRFVTALGGRIVVDLGDAIVARIHRHNTCQKGDDGNLKNRERWTPVEWDDVLATGYQSLNICG